VQFEKRIGGRFGVFYVEKKVFKAEGPGAVYDLVRKSEIF
jgi:hypothetical protein